MALLKWGFGDEENKKDDLTAPFSTPHIQSVQDSWQPSKNNASLTGQSTSIFDQNNDQQGNYLMSTQKAQIDEQKHQQDAAEEAARQAAAAEASEARRRAAAAQEAEVATQNQDETEPRYVNSDNKDEGLWGSVKGIGAGIQQGFGALGDIAIEGGGVLDEAANQLRGGSDAEKDARRVTNIANSDKLRSALHGLTDINGNQIVGTQDVDEAAGNIAAGRGTAQDYVAVGGKGLQAGIDATMFMNPSRMLLPTRALPAVTRASTMLGRIAANPAVQYAARDAAFYGGLQGAATGASTYGQTGDVGEAAKNALTDALVGGALQGTLDLGGHVVGKGSRKAYESLIPVANKTLESLRKPGEFRLGDEPVEITPQQPEQSQQQPNAPDLNDGNISFEDRLNNSGLGGTQEIYLAEPPSIADMPGAIPLPADSGAAGIRSGEVAPIADGVAQPTNIATNDLTPATEPRAMDAPEQISTPVENPVENSATPSVADGAVIPSKVMPTDANLPQIRSEELRGLQDAKAGTSQADEAQINQRVQELNQQTPATNALPDEMMGNSNEVVAPTPMTREQVAQRLMPKLADNSDVKQRIADSVGMGMDANSPVRDILRDGGVKPVQAERVATHFDNLERQLQDYNRLEEMNQKAYAEGGADALSEDVSRERSRVTRDMGVTTRRLMDEIDRLDGSRDKKAALVRGITDLIGTRNASVLTSAGLLERNIGQEFTANAKLALKNPIQMARSTFGNGNILKDTAKGELSHWKDAPRNPIEAMKYVVGNTYRTAMIPTTALANTRRGAVRDELTKWAYKELEGRDLSSSEAHKLAGAAGNEMEALVNTFIGVDNGMTNRGQATEALKAWKEYIRSGDDGAKAEFLKRVETHSSLADQMIAGLSKDDATKARGLMAMKNLIFPFVRTATNLMKTTVQQDLNPFAKSLLDEIRADQRSGSVNVINTIKSKLVDYGILGGAAALASSGILAYNDGDQVDRPRGWAIKIGDNQYIPVRATSLELPIAMAGTAQTMAHDIAQGKPRDWQYYAGMVTGSLPYIDQFNTTTGAVDSLMSGEDGGYAAKNYAVNMAKSFVPFSNNGVQPYVAGKQGESLNAKSVYDDNLATWFSNTIRKSYDPEFYNSLKDSRDNAGRIRTVDNQGIISNKTINDANTARYNGTIDSMVRYGRENGFGQSTQDMFNSYDTGKNNNFKSVQDAVTFLDTNGGKPDNAKKLEQNPKLADLSRQMRDGFYGATGNDLLTLDGQGLKSDASAPNKAGSKNARLPLSMQSIKNAVAQTDLGKEASDKLYAISGQNTDLYNQLKAKSISYEQYSAAKSSLNQQEIDILSASPNYQKMVGLMNELNGNGFFDDGGMGSTKAGQTYLWNSLNTLLGSKGATPAAQYPDMSKGFTPFGGRRGTGRTANSGGKGEGTDGVKWTPVTARQMAQVARGTYTPVNVKVKLGSAVKKDRTQNYSDRSF